MFKLTIKKILKQYYTLKVKRSCKSYKSVNVNRKSIVTRNTILGSNVHFNGMIIEGKGNIVIGDNFHSGRECQILSDVHNYHGTSIPYDNTFIKKNITIENNVWIGNRVIIIGNVTIGEGAIIQAGSVVVNDIPKLSIAGGNPAKVFSKRNEQHYFEKIESGSFF